jgi:hypothetical protein
VEFAHRTALEEHYNFRLLAGNAEGDGLRFWQDLLDPVQQLVADGCHLKRDTLGFIEAAQFASVDARRITVNGASLFGPHVVGSACVA